MPGFEPVRSDERNTAAQVSAVALRGAPRLTGAATVPPRLNCRRSSPTWMPPLQRSRITAAKRGYRRSMEAHGERSQVTHVTGALQRSRESRRGGAPMTLPGACTMGNDCG